jgi:phosphocarrier protein HPr
MSQGKGKGDAVRRTLQIKNRLGLHARAAAQFVQTANRYGAELTVTKEGQSINGKSIIGLMMLAAACGSSIEVVAEGPDAVAAMAAIEALIDRKFDED